MKSRYIPSLLFLLFGAILCSGQGTLQPLVISFDGPPYIAPGTGRLVSDYFESGMWFRPVPPGQTFGRLGGGLGPNVPDNGTAFLQAGVTDSLMFSLTNGATFDMVSVDLAEYSTVVGPRTVHLIAYRHDSTTVTADMLTSGINFHTVSFDPRFVGIDRVEIPNWGWSLDNLVVFVPEPGVAPLALVGVLLVAGKLRRPAIRKGKGVNKK